MIVKNLPEELVCGFDCIKDSLRLGKTLVMSAEKCDSGFFIVKDGNDVKIGYSEKAAFFRAIGELANRQDEEKLHISGECMFKNFAVMEDMSRNSVAKVGTIKSLIEKMALMGYNELQLYTEDTFEVEKEPYFGYMRGRFTCAEIKEIDEYAMLFGLELVPCIQTLAHLNQIARYNKYAEIIDVFDILLAEEPGTYELLENMILTVSKNFTSRRINIGMDEAHLLGLGKYLNKHGYKTRYEIMTKHLKKVGEILEKYGFSAEMWSDMFFRLIFSGDYYRADLDKLPKQMLDSIPDSIRLIYWDYYSLDFERYDGMMKCHKAISKDTVFAGGLWKWMGLVPENSFSMRATESAFAACRKNALSSCIMTSWGDDGGEASMFSVLPAMWYAAQLAYDRPADEGHFESLFKVSFKDFMLLDLPNFVAGNTVENKCNHSKYLLYNDVLIGTFDSAVPENANAEYAKIADKLKPIESGVFSHIFRSICALSKVLSNKAEIGLKLKSAYDRKDRKELGILADTLAVIADDICEFKQALYAQWEKENKSFGLEVQNIRLGGLYERVLYAQKKVLKFVSGQLDRIDELEEKRLPFAYYDAPNPKEISYNQWKNIVSPSVI